MVGFVLEQELHWETVRYPRPCWMGAAALVFESPDSLQIRPLRVTGDGC